VGAGAPEQAWLLGPVHVAPIGTGPLAVRMGENHFPSVSIQTMFVVCLVQKTDCTLWRSNSLLSVVGGRIAAQATSVESFLF
jgi:hypothetical protein